MKKRILLVNPSYQKETRWVTDDDTHAQMGHDMLPLGLATVAALTPEEYEVQIWDEPVRGRIEDGTTFAHEYDLVGITGYRAHLSRAAEVADLFRKRGLTVCGGGPGVSGSPDRCRDDYDVLFIGEAELTWPRFLRDWEAGRYKSEYRQIEKIDLAQSPMPRWDSIAGDIPQYAVGCVQTTRGCPFDCEFCDVIYLYGRKQRHKTVGQVIEEVKVLAKLGMSSIFFCDDEFMGNPKYAKELLRALIPVNNSFKRPLTYSTQLTMNLSRDDEMLRLIADANFYLVFLGVETPNKASLKETGKYQNIRPDLLGDIHKILSYGVGIRAGTIVGFDHDDKDIFDIQYDFIQKACLPSVSLNMLKAAIGTRLWTRLRREGRILDLTAVLGEGLARVYTNIIPKRMTRVELMQGFRGLAARIYDWQSFAERMCGWVSLIKRPPDVPDVPMDPSEVARLGKSLSNDESERRVIDDIMDHTRETCPRMVRRVRELVIQHARYRSTVLVLLEQMDQQIERELAGKISFKQDTRPVPIPESFRQAFDRQVFPATYKRVYLNLDDKSAIPEATTEVFVDFLARWGEEFNELEKHHFTFLDELADRTCAKFNGVEPQSFHPVADGEVPMAQVKRMRLSEDVLKSVEQELVRLGQAGAAA